MRFPDAFCCHTGRTNPDRPWENKTPHFTTKPAHNSWFASSLSSSTGFQEFCLPCTLGTLTRRFFHIFSHVQLTFSTFSTLSRNDVTFISWGATITITWTKTRRCGDTALVIPIQRIPNSPLCHVTALHALFQAVHVSAHAHAFSYYSTNHRFDCITASIFRSSIILPASCIGSEPKNYSEHS